MSLPKHVKLIEVGPRDGLQNEKTAIPTATKIALIERLVGAGVRHIEAASFVSPKWVPQMADGVDVMAGIQRVPGVCYGGLTPNLKGFEAALAAGADEVLIFGAASESFAQKNLNCSIAESVERFRAVSDGALRHGIRLRGSISCALGCPYEGDISIAAVVDLVKRLRDLGCEAIDIADTLGVGTPHRVQDAMGAAAREFPLEKLAGHFHDTYGQALANIYASLEVGIPTFHTSVAGLGGCPFAPGATGNVATEDVLFMLNGLGIETGIDLKAIVAAGQFIAAQLGRPAASRAGNAFAGTIARCQ